MQTPYKWGVASTTQAYSNPVYTQFGKDLMEKRITINYANPKWRFSAT